MNDRMNKLIIVISYELNDVVNRTKVIVTRNNQALFSEPWPSTEFVQKLIVDL